MIEVPLGKREGPRLEFKRAAALEKPDTLARAVVALLNASGGEVWVGVEERDETATGLDPVTEPVPAVAARMLHDHLIDVIEPPPSAPELRVETVPAPGGGGLIHVVVGSQRERKPYAVLRRGGRHYLIRVGSRTRPMLREEIRDLFRKTQEREDTVREARHTLLKNRERAAGGIWCTIRPVELAPALDLGDEAYERLLMDPLATGNRAKGWTFANPYQRPVRAAGRLVQETPGLKCVTLCEEGSLLLEVPKNGLAWRNESLYPFALIEYPTSLFRLASALYLHAGARCRTVLADLALFDAKGLALRRGSPYFEMFEFDEQRIFDEGDDLVLTPLELAFEEVMETPDRCAARLWGRVYNAFGFDPSAWPPEYDRETGGLELKD